MSAAFRHSLHRFVEEPVSIRDSHNLIHHILKPQWSQFHVVNLSMVISNPKSSLVGMEPARHPLNILYRVTCIRDDDGGSTTYIIPGGSGKVSPNAHGTQRPSDHEEQMGTKGDSSMGSKDEICSSLPSSVQKFRLKSRTLFLISIFPLYTHDSVTAFPLNFLIFMFGNAPSSTKILREKIADQYYRHYHQVVQAIKQFKFALISNIFNLSI